MRSPLKMFFWSEKFCCAPPAPLTHNAPYATFECGVRPPPLAALAAQTACCWCASSCWFWLVWFVFSSVGLPHPQRAAAPLLHFQDIPVSPCGFSAHSAPASARCVLRVLARSARTKFFLATRSAPRRHAGNRPSPVEEARLHLDGNSLLSLLLGIAAWGGKQGDARGRRRSFE